MTENENKSAPALDLRHIRLHVVLDGVHYTVYTREQANTLHRNPFTQQEITSWRVIEHVIDDGHESYLGHELHVPRERVALEVSIPAEEYEAAKTRSAS